MKCIVTLFMQGLVAALIAGARDMPSELAALTAKARLSRPVAWCRAEFRSGHAGAFAVAVASADGGGRYAAVDSDGSADGIGCLQTQRRSLCYSRAQAEKLDARIKTIRHHPWYIRPRWNTTVVCGFIDDTAATCWQDSPADRAFVKIGQWIT